MVVMIGSRDHPTFCAPSRLQALAHQLMLQLQFSVKCLQLYHCASRAHICPLCVGVELPPQLTLV